MKLKINKELSSHYTHERVFHEGATSPQRKKYERIPYTNPIPKKNEEKGKSSKLKAKSFTRDKKGV